MFDGHHRQSYHSGLHRRGDASSSFPLSILSRALSLPPACSLPLPLPLPYPNPYTITCSLLLTRAYGEWRGAAAASGAVAHGGPWQRTEWRRGGTQASGMQACVRFGHAAATHHTRQSLQRGTMAAALRQHAVRSPADCYACFFLFAEKGITVGSRPVAMTHHITLDPNPTGVEPMVMEF